MKKVLIADDSPTVLKIMATSLFARGYAVKTAVTTSPRVSRLPGKEYPKVLGEKVEEALAACEVMLPPPDPDA